MSSHAYMDENLFDRDALTPKLRTPNVFEVEPHSGIRPERLDNGWLTASSELWDQTANHEATSARTMAASTGSLKNCYSIPEPDQSSTSSLIPFQPTVAHEQVLVDDVVCGESLVDDFVFRGGLVDYPVLLLQPYTHQGVWTGVPHQQTLTHGLQNSQEVEETWNKELAMLEIADLDQDAASPGSMHTVRDREYGSNSAMQKITTRTRNAPDIPFRVETKKVYVCTHTGCNKKYSRMPDLRRHYRGSHLDDRPFQCRALGCERAIHGFPRRDKRDLHEKKMHIDIGDGILL